MSRKKKPVIDWTEVWPDPICLRLPVPQSANRGQRHRRGQRRPYKPAIVREYQQLVYNTAMELCSRLPRTHFSTRPPLFSEGIPVEVAVEWHRQYQLGDLDNRLKIVLDALQGALYVKDKQVVRIVADLIERPGQDSEIILVVRARIPPAPETL